MMRHMIRQKAITLLTKTTIFAVFLGLFAPGLRAEIDGHGPDAWRVTGVSSNDTLNVRMGPGTSYPVIDTFAHNERNLQQITCVPYYTPAHYTAMSAAQLKALPPRWCMMRNAAMTKAGWVAQRFITPEGAVAYNPADTTSDMRGDPDQTAISLAQGLVYEVYDRQFLSELGPGMASPLDPSIAPLYFTDDIVAWLRSGNVGAHPLYGAQDFDGTVAEPEPDAERPIYRGMITLNVDITNFGKTHRAVFYVRADTTKNGAPLRIFRVEHDGWSYP